MSLAPFVQSFSFTNAAGIFHRLKSSRKNGSPQNNNQNQP